MKFIRILLVSLLLIVTIGVVAKPTEAQLFPSYVSGITIQNLSSTAANVQVSYYSGGSATPVLTTTDSILPFALKDFAAVPVTAPFKGSVVISSDQPVGAVSTLRGDNKGRGAYVGSTAGSTSVAVPFIMKNWGRSGWNTYFSVQNVGSGDATVKVDYAACPNPVDTQAVIKPNNMYVFTQSNEACLGAKSLTSARITSDQPVVLVSSQESTVVNSSLVSNGFTVGSNKPVIPLVNSNNPNTTGWRTAISLFNMGTVATNVTLQYVSTTGVTCSETRTINPNTSAEFAGNGFITGNAALTCAVGQRFIGAAYVTTNSANQPLVATVNQDRGSLSSAYGAFDPAAGTPKVALPQIQDRNGAVSDWASSFNVMNAGTAATYVKCTFANTAYTVQFGQIAPNGVKEDLQRGKIAPSYVGSGECTAYTSAAYTTIDTAAKLLAVVNVRGMGVGQNDLMMSYEGINISLTP